MSKEFYPITDPEIRKKFGQALKDKYLGYYIAYEIIVETGIAGQNLLEFKVEDIKNKEIITVPKWRGEGTENLPLSKPLQKNIAEYIDGAPLHRNLLVSRHQPEKPLILTTLKYVLSQTAQELGLEDISIFSLRKTYMYNLLQSTGDVELIKRKLHLENYYELYDYFGVDGNLPDLKKYVEETNCIAELIGDITTKLTTINENYMSLSEADISKFVKYARRKSSQLDYFIQEIQKQE